MADNDSDEAIARNLRDVTGELHVSQQELEAWLYQEGYTDRTEGFAINRLLGCSTRTIQRYAKRVRYCVDRWKVLAKEGHVRFGHSCAQGSMVRFTKDGTPLGALPGSSWNEERLKSAHAGSQRKPAAPAPRRKKPVVTAVQRADRDYQREHEK